MVSALVEPDLLDMRTDLLKHYRQSLLRHIVVWAVVFALPANGLSNMLLHLLGPQHQHTTHEYADISTRGWSFGAVLEQVVGQDAMAIINDFHARQKLRVGLFAMASDFGPHQKESEAHVHPHVHSHHAFERHFHDPRDGSVMAIGPTDTGQDAAAASHGGIDIGAALPMPFEGSPAIAHHPVAERSPWRSAAQAAWQSHVSTPLERPPCA